MENGWIFQLKKILNHFCTQVEAFQPFNYYYKALGRAAAEGFSKPIVQYCTPWKSDGKVPKIGATLKFWFSAQDRTF